MDESGGSVSASKERDKFCDFCETILRKGQKCNLCKVNSIHLKYLDSAVKTRSVTDKKNWLCRSCKSPPPLSDTSSEDSAEERTIISIDNEKNGDDVRYLKIENDMLKKQISLLNKIIEELNNVNKLQKEKIENIELPLKTQNGNVAHSTGDKRASSYSDALKTAPKNVLIVKPVNKNQTSEDTCRKIKDVINPATISVEVNNITLRKDGCVAINCSDSKNLELLQTNIADKVGSDYNTEILRKINPKVILFNVRSEDVTDKASFCDQLCVQNKISITNTTVLKVVRVIGQKNNVNVILELDPTTFKFVVLRGSLYVGWSRCGVRESFHTTRCYKCSGYGHFAKNCKFAEACPKCAGNHTASACVSDVSKCINCVSSNEKLKTNYNIDHTVFDHSCSSYRKICNNIKAITRYDEE